MVRTYWNTLAGNLAATAASPAKRTPLGRNRWGLETEQLESRALLSASALHADDSALPAMIEAAVPRKAAAIQNVAGTWVVTGNGLGKLTSLGDVEGTASFTQQPTKIIMEFSVDGIDATATITLPLKGSKTTAVIKIEGLAAINVSGTVTKNNISFKGKVPVNGKNTPVELAVKFASGENPETFTGTLKATGKVVLKFQGEKQ